MKKRFPLILLTLLVSIFVLSSLPYADQVKSYFYPFSGRWQPSEDPALIDEHGFQDIQNLRKDGKRLKGVSGHTKVNSSVIDSSYKYPRTSYHFRKSQPSESHYIVQCGTNSSFATTKLYQNTTAIPNTGNFSSTVLHTDASGSGPGRYSIAPIGNMLYCNSEESLIWGGDEARLTSAFTCSDSSNSDPVDETEALQTSRQDSGYFALFGTGGIDSYTVLMLHCEGADESTTFTDSSDTPHTVTANGDAQIDVDQHKFGLASGLFDGTGDYLSVPDHADWYMGTGTFTIDFWVRFDSLPPGGGNVRGFFQQYADSNNFVHLLIEEVSGNYRLQFTIKDSASTTVSFNTSAQSFSTNTWYHIFVTRGWGGNANDWAAGIDGTAGGTTTDSDEWPDIGAAFEIGESTLNTVFIDGWIDEFRVSKGVARWTSNFTPPTRPYPSTDRPYLLLGSTRPIQGFKAYVLHPNTETSTLTVNEWTGSAWSSLSITDNTASGGVSMAQTGTVTFDSTVNTSVPRVIEGEYLFWYQVNLSAGLADLYYITVDAPIQNIVNLWDATPVTPLQFQVYDGGYWEDYSEEVTIVATVDYETAPLAAELDDLADTEYVYIAFPVRVSGIKFNMTSHLNANAATPTVYYWDNSSADWASVGTVTDGTAVSGKSLARSGYMTWNPPAPGEEAPRNLFGLRSSWTTTTTTYEPMSSDFESVGDFTNSALTALGISPVMPVTTSEVQSKTTQVPPGYYYKIMWSATLSADVLVDTVSGITAYEKDEIPGYKFPLMFQGRSFLCSETIGEKNKCIYSGFDMPDVWNGIDSGLIRFGDDSELTAGCVLYNFYHLTGLEQAIFTKPNETWRLIGNGPTTWTVDQLSPNVGCPAPLSMAVCDITEITEGAIRNVAVWQTASGVVRCDGTKLEDISHDIKCYWDRNDSRCIPAAYMDDSVGWYDPNLYAYKLLIYSNSAWLELEYSLEYNEWTKLYRENASGANPLLCGCPVIDTTGNVYTYGVTSEGYAYRLENGNTWDSVENIDEYVWTKNLPLGGFFKHSTINYFRLMFEDKTTTPDPDIAITHYCDNTATTDNANNQEVPDGVDLDDGPFDTHDCVLGECLMHSFKLQAAECDIADGMELIGLGLVFDEYETIME